MNDNELNTFMVMGCCGKKYPFHDYDLVNKIISGLNLNDDKKQLILCRIQRIYYKIYEMQKIYKYSYFYSRVYIMIASIISPAITSINTDKQKTYYVVLWWVTWNLQILISLITSISTFFKWDRNYFLYSEYKDSVEEEVWRYLEGIGEYKYDASNNIIIENIHEQNLPLFFRRLEFLYSNLCLKDTEIKLNNDYNKDSIFNRELPHEITNTEANISMNNIQTNEQETTDSPTTTEI